MPYTWLLFDADGTLFDFNKAEAGALVRSFTAAGLPCPPETIAAYHRINAQVWSEFEAGTLTAQELRLKRFSLLFAEIGANLDVPRFSTLYLKNLALGSELEKEAEETIKALAGRYQLAIITNGLVEVQRSRLALSSLASFFPHMFISEELGVAKPAPGFFEAVFEKIGHPSKSSALVIGDSLSSDIQGGIAFGLDTCWYNPLGNPPTPGLTPRYEIRRLSTLVALLA